MRHRMIHLMGFMVLALFPGNVSAGADSRFELDVVVEGVKRPEYRSGRTVYVEALRGQEYELRLTNPTPHRVAVALSVDGLNTIDARHTDPWRAAKWVLGPHESAVISGWQVDSGFARRFFFTTEEGSYASALGETENQGVIEAVVYRERVPTARILPEPGRRERSADKAAPSSAGVEQQSKRQSAGELAAPGAESIIVEDYAATGMGERTRHEVERVHLELESHPISTVRIRYEYRPQLVELGILPDRPSPLQRRERAQGFAFCPEP